MWETEVICKECEKPHLVCAEVIPRAFTFECPDTNQRVDMPFRDPSRIPDPWSEVSACSPRAITAIFTEEQGTFEM